MSMRLSMSLWWWRGGTTNNFTFSSMFLNVYLPDSTFSSHTKPIFFSHLLTCIESSFSLFFSARFSISIFFTVLHFYFLRSFNHIVFTIVKVFNHGNFYHRFSIFLTIVHVPSGCLELLCRYCAWTWRLPCQKKSFVKITPTEWLSYCNLGCWCLEGRTSYTVII